MVTQPLSLPSFPPDGPWDAYVSIIIWIPLILRILLLVVPFRRAIGKLAPHTGWVFKQIRELPVKGFGLLAVNELLAMLFPPLIVLGIRLIFDPIGWQEWSEVTNLASVVLLLLLFFWIFLDLFRIARIRRMLKAVEKYDVNKLRKVADTGLKVRKWLKKFSSKDETKPDRSDTEIVKSSGKRALTTSMAIWAGRAFKARKLTPAGLVSSVAFGVAIEAARGGAEKISDLVDKKMQDEFDKIAKISTNTLIVLFIRDLLMGLAPLVALWLLPKIL